MSSTMKIMKNMETVEKFSIFLFFLHLLRLQNMMVNDFVLYNLFSHVFICIVKVI